MPPFTSILVDIDASAGVHPALDRAIALARHWGARLRIVDVVHVPGRLVDNFNVRQLRALPLAW